MAETSATIADSGAQLTPAQVLLDPLPRDLANLTSKANAATALSLDTVQTIIDRLEAAKAKLQAGQEVDYAPLIGFVKQAGSKVAEKHKDWGKEVNKWGKNVDKKFTTELQSLFPPAAPPSNKTSSSDDTYLPMDTDPGSTNSVTTNPDPFSTPESLSALHSTIALHLARQGSFFTLSAFASEAASSVTPPPSDLLSALQTLHAILADLTKGDCGTALEWLKSHPGADPDGDLEFALRKEEFIRILLEHEDPSGASDPLLPKPTSTPSTSSSTSKAILYGGTHFLPLHTPSRTATIQALLTSPLYLPFSRLLTSPYAHLFLPYSSTSPSPPWASPATLNLEHQFSEAFFKAVGVPRESALKVVTDVGGPALRAILKVSKVMKDKKTEWSAVDELPVEIPLPPAHRYHSIFACPVSKEQSTPTNPPMLLPCGHVIARESLIRLARGTPTLKCPYCPVVSQLNMAVRVHF